MTNSTNLKLANNSNSFDYDKQTNKGWILGCLAMVVVYLLIIGGLFLLWFGVDAASVFDGTWQPTYP